MLTVVLHSGKADGTSESFVCHPLAVPADMALFILYQNTDTNFWQPRKEVFLLRKYSEDTV